ncbi:MAG: hypothetical protein WBK19_10295 [Azonexus sp.]
MSSSHWIHTNPGLRQVNLGEGFGFVVYQKIGERHYLVWKDGVAITEVRAVPSNSSRWYYKGAGLRFVSTREKATKFGIGVFKKEPHLVKLGQGSWSELAIKEISK